MTYPQACKVIGISRSSGKKKAREIYTQKKASLQLQLRPGMSKEVRQRAADQLAELTTAWNIYTNGTKNKATRRPARPEKKNTPQPARAPQKLGRVWQVFFDMMPLPKPVTFLIMVFVWLWLLRAFLSLFGG